MLLPSPGKHGEPAEEEYEEPRETLSDCEQGEF